MKKQLFSLLRLIAYNLSIIILIVLLPNPVYAIADPLSVSNNKFGIHIISPTVDEASPAADLVNSSGGDWGYVTFLLESKDRDVNRIQQFFDYLRKRHLIPLVRLATQPQDGGFWKRPYEGEEVAWADFLDSLRWPVKNRYVIIYNEPNHALEWGKTVDPKDYAKTLNKTIDALKKKNEDFFVLNAGFDASTPHEPPNYYDQLEFMQEMEEEVPGIFQKLDGWVSHSYPNPGFAGSPEDSGRGTVRTFLWELEQLKKLGVTKTLPVFITETGWKHSDGQNINPRLPSPENVAQYYEKSFNGAWNNGTIVAVTPFLLNYQDPPFDHFSFKKNAKTLSRESSEKDFHLPYYILQSMPKVRGKPVQDFVAKIISGSLYSSLVKGERYTVNLTFKNTGQAIWNETEQVKLVPVEGGNLIENESLAIPFDQKVEPGGVYSFALKINAKESGLYKVKLELFHGTNKFSTEPVEFTTEIKSPVILQVKATLKWKEDFAGEYILSYIGVVTDRIKYLTLPKSGTSEEITIRSLLPDNTYDFTLEKPFYKSKTISQKVREGLNILDFGEMEPNIVIALLRPMTLWSLLPFSN